ncbi:hypothetical protein GGX14DRAFT_578188 [Mycena pura]|uniref:Uncharacterized protein n=1 Tax=Mycena pura TaxID=153505 RepID=A0AAD6UT85_9AGAR|nr:hypothetical protein GGX14DRAFT_578188 [Mycena pura]
MSSDRNKILPHGVPIDIFENAEDYGALDFRVRVHPDAIAQVRDLYASPEQEVFQPSRSSRLPCASDTILQRDIDAATGCNSEQRLGYLSGDTSSLRGTWTRSTRLPPL